MGAITGSKILRIMKGLGLAPEIPEDLYHLIKKAVSMRKHLELNRKDKDGKFRLILVESRIHRLARYYKVRSPCLQVEVCPAMHQMPEAGCHCSTSSLSKTMVLQTLPCALVDYAHLSPPALSHLWLCLPS